MRWLVFVTLVACGNKVPSPPEAAAWAKMDDEEKCRQTFPRTADCIDDLMAEQVRSIAGGSDLGDVMEKKLKDDPATDREAVKIHKISCAGDRTYADAVYACWKSDGCAALAKCVYKPK